LEHELKILPKYFRAVNLGDKTFELRENDRNFRVGDELILKEWDPENEKYTGRTITRYISYIYNGTGEYGLQEGYCILGIKRTNRFFSS
jgi:hypothetical protein